MSFKTQKTLNSFLSALMVILALPTTAILASWNSIPGSGLYPIKRGLEKIALKLLPASVLEIEFRNKLIDRRFSEANSVLIQQSSTRGLPEIVAEAKSAQIALSKLSPQAKTQATPQLIQQLNSTNQKLETVKTTFLNTSLPSPALPSPALPSPAPQASPQPSVQPTIIPVLAAPVSEIAQTQEELEMVIDNIENDLLPTREKNNERGRGKHDQQNKQEKNKQEKKD